MKRLIHPFLFAVARLGLFLSVVAWIVGHWWDVEFLAHGARFKIVVDRCGITFSPDWVQAGGGFGGGFGDGFGGDWNAETDAKTNNRVSDIDSHDEGSAEPGINLDSTNSGFEPAIIGAESESTEQNNFVDYEELVRAITVQPEAEGGPVGSMTINSNTISLIIHSGPPPCYLDPVPQPDCRPDSDRGWVEVQPAGMVFHEPASKWYQWAHVIQPDRAWQITSGVHVRHCLNVSLWSLICWLLLFPFSANTNRRPNSGRRRWILATLTILVASVMLQNGLQTREDWLVEQLRTSGANIYYEGGHAASVECESYGGDREKADSTTPSDDECLCLAASLPHLKYVRLTDMPVTDNEMAQLSNCNELQSLELKFYDTESEITDTGLKHIGMLTSLKSLKLRGVRFTNRGLAELKALSQLRELNIEDADISDAGVVHLRQLKDLQALEIGDCRKVTQSAIDELKRFLPNCYMRKL